MKDLFTENGVRSAPPPPPLYFSFTAVNGNWPLRAPVVLSSLTCEKGAAPSPPVHLSFAAPLVILCPVYSTVKRLDQNNLYPLVKHPEKQNFAPAPNRTRDALVNRRVFSHRIIEPIRKVSTKLYKYMKRKFQSKKSGNH
jgi:hypothetical protein